MQSIAVCEDEAIWREQLLTLLQSIKTEGELHITAYSSGEDFLAAYSPGQFDLIFMDIYMEKLNGADTIARLREIDPDVPVAFTTTSTDYALEAYRLNVIKYLEKPVKKSDVIDCLKIAAIKKRYHAQTTLIIAGKERTFADDEVLYLEQSNHTLVVHLSNGTTLTCSGKLDDYADELSADYFYRCHKSYLVNLTNVVKIDPSLKVFTMKDGSNAYIKREKVKEAILRLDRFLFAQMKKGR